MKKCNRNQCLTNITMPIDGENLTVSLDVEFEVAPPDPTVGIFGCGIDGFRAKVVDVDVETPTPELLAAVQAQFDANEEQYRDQIDEACLASLENY